MKLFYFLVLLLNTLPNLMYLKTAETDLATYLKTEVQPTEFGELKSRTTNLMFSQGVLVTPIFLVLFLI